MPSAPTDDVCQEGLNDIEHSRLESLILVRKTRLESVFKNIRNDLNNFGLDHFGVSWPYRTGLFRSLRPSTRHWDWPKRWRSSYRCPVAIVIWCIPTSFPSSRLSRFRYRWLGFLEPSAVAASTLWYNVVTVFTSILADLGSDAVLSNGDSVIILCITRWVTQCGCQVRPRTIRRKRVFVIQFCTG